MANLRFSLKERQNSARFNSAAVIISKMTSLSCEERNCSKGLLLFFFTTTSNIALTFPTKTELLGCLEGSRELNFFLLKFATNSFPGLTSRVSLFNVNVLNHKDKLSVKTVQIKFRKYSQKNCALSLISHPFNSKSELDA